MGQMYTQEDHPKKHDCIEEIHYLNESLGYYAADTIGILDLEDLSQVLGSDCLHGQVEGEEENGWGEVD